MSLEVFLICIVVALAVAVSLVAWSFRGRTRIVEPSSEPPVADALARLEAELREIELQRQRMLGGIEQHLDALSKETVALSQAMRQPQGRGRWGELTLRRVAELSGMVAYCDFFEQEAAEGQRPDMVVRLPGNRTLAVDAKVPLSAFLEAEAATGAEREAALQRHAQQLSRHVITLGGREYWAQFQPAPELVILFLAGDHFLNAALEHDPELLERAVQRNVLIATPMTFISVLKGIAYGWKQETLAENADAIRKIGSEFYDRLRAFADVYSDAGRHLARAVEAYNRSAGTWDARVLPSLRRMSDLGVGSGVEPPAIASNDTATRQPRAMTVSGHQ
jgi:DNA recombination protein RmuC